MAPCTASEADEVKRIRSAHGTNWHTTRGLEFQFALAGVQDAAFQLCRDRTAHRRRVVAEHQRPHAEIIVDQPVAVGVEHERSFGARDDQRRGRDAKTEIAADAPRQ